MTALRVQVKRGQRKPPGSKVVKRPSRFGSPFKVHDGPGPVPSGWFTRADSIAWHRRFVQGDPEAVDLARRLGWRYADLNGAALVDLIRTELPGYDLGCECGPDKACHADLLLAVAAGGQP